MQGEIMKYYVYGHYNKCDNQLFYIGKGTNNRLKSTTSRSIAWIDHTNSNEWYAEIIHANLSEDEALAIEKKLIEENYKTILNNNTNNKVKVLPDFSSLFYYNESSPSGLSWLDDNIGINGILYNRKDTTVGSIDCSKNMWKIVVNGKKYYIHRIIYSLYSDLKTDQVIDHLNGNSLDNRITNLQAKTQKENCRNIKRSSINTTGYTGVSFRVKKKYDKEYACYTSYFYKDNGKLSTKTFSVLKHGKEEAFRLACQWRKEQIEQLNANGAGYTDRHGT